MANLNNIDGTISTTNSQILAAGLNIPAKFNNSRTSGELAILYNAKGNAKQLYNNNKYSYKLPYDGSYKIGDTQSTFQWGVDDVKLIKSWQFSNTGAQFVIKQTLLQGLNPFNETKLYNPAMPIIGATSHATLGLVQGPTRFIEPNLGGVMGGLGLQGVSSLLNLDKPSAPQGTVAAQGGLLSNFLPSTATTDTLPSWSQTGVKGLLRGKTATDANKRFTDKWGNAGSGGFFGKLLGSAIGFIQSNTAIGTFFPIGQPSGTKYKVGESAYGSFLNNTNQKLFKSVARGDWSDDSNSLNDSGVYIQKYTAGTRIAGQKNGGKSYSDSVYNKSYINESSSPLFGKLETYRTASGITQYSSNFNETTDKSTIDIIYQLNSLLAVPAAVGEYVALESNYIATNYRDLIGIKSHEDTVSKTPPEKYSNTDKITSYSKAKISDVNLLTRKGINTNTPDSINLLGPLDADSVSISPNNDYTNLKYDPYRSDIIAFYFYDIVNKKYIPFRATVKGIQESLQSNWEEIKYINRADKLYTYGGFTRTLNFNFNVVITSIKELLPTWKRINYLAGLAKPANYTDGTVYSRFIIPPLIQFTIGDMYKNQPAVITQIGITIPDNASWETVAENGANNPNQQDDSVWEYGRIQWTGPKNGTNGAKGYYAQFPNECEISINMNLLEKELSHTGGSNYGDYYYNSDMKNPSENAQNGGSFSSGLYMLNKNGENQVKAADNPPIKAKTVEAQPTPSTTTTPEPAAQPPMPPVPFKLLSAPPAPTFIPTPQQFNVPYNTGTVNTPTSTTPPSYNNLGVTVPKTPVGDDTNKLAPEVQSAVNRVLSRGF